MKAIVCGHVPLHPDATQLFKIAVNSQEILETIWSFSNVCVGYFCGHHHMGGHCVDKNNILHITFPAILEAPLKSCSHSLVKVYKDRIEVDLVTDKIQTFERKF